MEIFKKLKSDREGFISIILLVGMLIMTGILSTYMIIQNEAVKNAMTVRRTNERYLAESAIDIQKHILNNKFDNMVLMILYDEIIDSDGNSLGRFLVESEEMFDPMDFGNGMDEINIEVNNIISSHGFSGILKSFTSNIKIVDPENSGMSRIHNLCGDANFWIDVEGNNKNPEDYVCNLNDIYFMSEINYLGVSIQTGFVVKNLKLFRYPFTSLNGDSHGVAKAIVITDNMEIETKSFQNYKR